jgi:prepilin signal peptidase PulO-like enzyme (type II secretory pathway)
MVLAVQQVIAQLTLIVPHNLQNKQLIQKRALQGALFFCYNGLMDFKILFDIFVFIFGLCIGSFLNCVIYRLESEKTLAGRSFCPHCKHTLAWYDLVPVFSYLFLFGKCRYCRRNISFQYPVVELFTATLFILVFNFLGIVWTLDVGIWDLASLVFLLYIASVLVVIFVYDLKHYLIPDKILLPAIVIAFIYKVFMALEFSNWDLIRNLKLEIGNSASLLNLALAVVVASGFFFLIWLVSKGRWMGFGDVKLAVLMGLLLGFQNVLVALFLAFFLGAIIGVILMAFPFDTAQGRQKKGLKSEIPFGPFLILGTFLALFWGQNLVQWYLNLFLF